jgi:hypothetical protein
MLMKIFILILLISCTVQKYAKKFKLVSIAKHYIGGTEVKKIKSAAFLILIVLISVSLTSGLELTASTGGNDGSSSTHVVYGATVDDYANEHIGLNPGEATLSNSFSGTGNLPSSSIGISDTKGNYAYVSRSVSGKPVTTKWNYDWNTYYPYSSTAGSGVGAWLSLSSSNAYSIYGSGYASNREGDSASASTTVGSSGTTSSLSNYYVNPYAFSNEADANQNAISASGNQIVYKTSASNKEFDNSWLTAEVYGGINGYASSASGKSASATAKQSANSASGQVIWFLEQAQNNEKDTVGVQAAGSIYPNVGAIIQNGQLTSYSGSATSTKTSVARGADIATLSGSSINFGPYAWNNEKDSATSILSSTTGSISGYHDSASAVPTYATAYQSMNSITSTGATTIQGTSNNAANDYSTASIYVSSGTITSPTSNTYASLTSDYAYPTASKISTLGNGNTYAYASNPQGVSSNSNLRIANGAITNPNFYAWSQPSIVETNLVSLTSATGSLVDLTSHAENTRFADEGMVYLAGGISKHVTPNYGGANFEVQAKSLTSTKLQSDATTSNVVITPTLPASIKTAIMLEPFSTAHATYGATNLGTTVFPDLVAKGYATLRYTDSGATYDKYQNLGNYNVVVADGHGDQNGISLSTINPQYSNQYYIPSSQLNYKAASTNSLVILTMCSGFSGYPKTKSNLANAFGSAYLSAGFAYDDDGSWADAYLRYFFDSLSAGNTASYADSFAHQKVNSIYGSDSIPADRVPLQFYPLNGQHSNFKL